MTIHSLNKAIKYASVAMFFQAATLSSFSHASSQGVPGSFWDMMNLYENEDGDYLKATGRIHIDSIWLNSEQSGNISEIFWRRARVGVIGKHNDIMYNFDIDFDLNESLSDSFARITNANVSWYLDSGARVKVLKQKVPFMLGGKASSNMLLTPERSNLTHNLWFVNEYFTGVSIEDTLDNDFHYFAGLYSSAEDQGIALEKPGFFGFYSIGKSYGANEYWDNAIFSFDTIVNDSQPTENTEDFSQVTSFSSQIQRDQWGVWTDIAYGNGEAGQSNLWGYEIMPFYSQSDKIQWVTRYTYMKSKDENGIRLGANNSKVQPGRGDKYREIYGGVNYYFKGHKMKVQMGVQYADMEDKADDGGKFNGWGLTTAFRMHW